MPNWRWAAVIALAGVICVPVHAQSAAESNAEGVALYKAGRWLDAIDLFVQAYEMAPDNTTVRRNLCNAYQGYANALVKDRNAFQDAIAVLENAIGVDPENPSPLVQLGSYYLRLDLAKDAAFRLEEAAELDPKSVDAQELLGDAYYKCGDLDAALMRWEWVAEAQPDRPGLKKKLDKAHREEEEEYDFSATNSRHFNISYDRGATGGDLSKVLTTCERAYREIGRQLGNVYPPAPIQVVLYDTQGFERVTQLGEHVGAVYDGRIKVPIKDKAGNSLPLEELERRLYHEFTHVVVRYWVSDNVPWWLNEGLAETFSRPGLNPMEKEVLARAYQEDALFQLADLTDSQLDRLTPEQLRRGYIQSHATVRFMFERFGLRSLTIMMNALAQGEGHEEALVRGYRRNYDYLQKDMASSYAHMASR
jgi:tetratricopeptide (TPR) repeat protein